MPRIEVPYPQQWREHSTLGMTCVLAVAVLFVVSAVALLVASLADREWVGALMSVAVAVFFSLVGLAAWASVRWRRARPVVVEAPEGAGLLFPFSRPLWWFAAGIWIVIPPVVAAGMALDLGDSGGRVSLRTLVAAAVGLLALVQCFNLVTGRLRRGHLLLEADGITLRTWGDEYRMAWPAGRAKEAGPPATAAKGPTLRIRSTGTDTQHDSLAALMGSAASRHLPDLVLRADALEGDAAVVAHAVAYYRRHPEHRSELTTDAALRRVLSGRAVVPRIDPGGL